MLSSTPKKANRLLISLGVIYLLSLVYILFLRNIGTDSPWTYAEYLVAMSNFKPLKSVVLLTSPVVSLDNVKLFLLSFVGNIVLFIPWGFMLPIHIEQAKKFRKFALISLVSIVLFEVVQLFTMLGSFDIEDILLNMLGSFIGFYCWNSHRRKCQK